MKDLHSFEAINPVISSAGYALTGLAGAGIPEAVKLYRQLYNETPEVIDTASPDGLKAASSIINIEFRYKAINRAIEKTGIRNVLDLGCGFSPRPLALSEMGYNVLGADLPVVIEKISPAAKALSVNGETNLTYLAVDATNAASLSDAADLLGDEIVIVTEGLLNCLTESELWTVVENIRTTLLRHGGVWITTDFDEKDFSIAGYKTIAGPEIAAELCKEHQKQIADRIIKTPEEKKVWEHIHGAADIHGYRAEYATAVYKAHARDIKDIPYDKINKGTGRKYQSDVYTCRKDEVKRKLDRAAMTMCSKALGHNRAEVFATNYLRGL